MVSNHQCGDADDGPDKYIIIGAVVGGFLLLLGVSSIVTYCLYRYRKLRAFDKFFRATSDDGDWKL